MLLSRYASWHSPAAVGHAYLLVVVVLAIPNSVGSHAPTGLRSTSPWALRLRGDCCFIPGLGNGLLARPNFVSPISRGSLSPVGPPFLRGRAGSSDVARNAFGDDDCDGMECPVDCVEEVLDFDTLKQLTEDSGSWQVTVSSSGEIKEQGQKLVVVEVYARDSKASALVRERFSAACSMFGDNEGDVLFVKVPVDAKSDRLRQWARDQGVTRLPTFILFKGGRRIDHFHGRDVYKGNLKQYIKDNQ